MEDVMEQLKEGENSPADPQINLPMKDFINHFASRTSPEVTARDRSTVQQEDLSDGATSISCRRISRMRRWLKQPKLARQKFSKAIRHYLNTKRPDSSETQVFCGKWIGSYDVNERIWCEDDEDDEGFEDEDDDVFEGSD
ncbi:MAG: hypothetical protein Q9172_002700 [Xanthocarpia lactea]